MLNFGITESTHIISIRNVKITSKDNQAFSICAENYNTIQIFDIVKKYVEDNYKSLFKSKVIFDNHKKKIFYTHSIVVTKKDKSEPSKSFGINAEQYNSLDIAKVISHYLCGDKCKFNNRESETNENRTKTVDTNTISVDVQYNYK